MNMTIGVSTIVVVTQARVWIVLSRITVTVGKLAGPLLAQSSTFSVVLETTVVQSRFLESPGSEFFDFFDFISSIRIQCIQDYLRDIRKPDNRILQHFGHTPISHAKIVSLGINFFRARIQDSSHFFSANFDPVELFHILYVRKSF